MFLRLLIFCLLFPIASSVLSSDIRIAILGDLNKNRAEIDVLTEKLSKEPGVTVVERSEIEKVLREQELAVGGASSTASAIKAGVLLGAQGVIVIKAFDFQGKSVLSARLVAVDSGAIVNVWVNDPDMRADSLSWGTAAAQMFASSIGKLTVSKADAIPVSILNIRSSWNNEAGLRFANKLRLLMELRLMMQKEVFILERWKLGALKWEKELQD
ncbi:MAG: CsgG/HfaB family protein, partial [Victivallales bacterium]